MVLRAERRSNFRDLCLQEFGKGTDGEEGLFEELSNEAETVFAQLTPPTPSKKREPARASATSSYTSSYTSSSTATSSYTYTSMPDEFMRGGGCFGPDSRVLVAMRDGSTLQTPVALVKPGDAVIGEGGKVAVVWRSIYDDEVFILQVAESQLLLLILHDGASTRSS